MIPPENDKTQKNVHTRVRTIMVSEQSLTLLVHIRKLAMESLAKTQRLTIAKDLSGYVFLSPHRSSKQVELSGAAFVSAIKHLNAKRSKQGLPLFVDPDYRDKDGQPRPVAQHGIA